MTLRVTFSRASFYAHTIAVLITVHLPSHSILSPKNEASALDDGGSWRKLGPKEKFDDMNKKTPNNKCRTETILFFPRLWCRAMTAKKIFTSFAAVKLGCLIDVGE
jgi:hypothetical protein